jgi:hypothetical protein
MKRISMVSRSFLQLSVFIRGAVFFSISPGKSTSDRSFGRED